MATRRQYLRATRECMSFNIDSAARTISRLYNNRLGKVGLNTHQFILLNGIYLHQPVSFTEAAEYLNLERSSLKRAIDILVREGWIHVEKADIGNTKLLSVTEAGWGKLEEGYEHWAAAQRLVKKHMGKELSSFLKGTQKLAAMPM